MNLAKLWTLLICSCLTHLALGQDSIQKHFASDSSLLLTPWKDGKINGIQKAYYSDGKLRGERSFENGKIKGPSKTYSKSGHLISVTYFDNNLQNGQDTSFYESGQIKSVCTLANGRQNGKYTSYDINGQVTNSYMCVNGRPDGIVKQYKNDKVITRAHYIKGKHDWFIFYNEDGSIRDSIHYTNDKRDNPKK